MQCTQEKDAHFAVILAVACVLGRACRRSHTAVAAGGLVLLLAAAACAGSAPPRAASTPKPATSGSGAAGNGSGGVQLTGDACRVLTAADVQSTLGVQVQQLPMSSPPPGGG